MNDTGRREDHLVVTMTTTPSRIEWIEPVLRSVLAQTVAPARLHLFIPQRHLRSGEAYVVPAWLRHLAEQHPVLELTPVEEDYGPATKLLPALSRYTDPRTRIVTVDDDVMLEEHTLAELMQASAMDALAVFGMMGVAQDGRFVHAEWVAASGQRRCQVPLLGGYRAVLYPRVVWDDSIWDDYRGITAVVKPFLSDDHLFAWNLLRRQVPCWVIATDYPRHTPDPQRFLSCLNPILLPLPAALTGADSARTAASIEALRCYYAQRGWPTTI